MSNGSAGDAPRREDLSALADGELDATAVARACAAWRADAELRAAWHAYHLVGDVLRSDDLAVPPARDEAFLQSLRKRLAAEPVVLAPEPVAQPLPAARPAGRAVAGARGGRWAWMAPSAVAAGFVLVAGALVVTRTPAPVAPPVTLAQQAPAAAPAATLAAAPALPPVQLPGTALAESPRLAPRAPRLLRDPQLDRYLAAHQQFAGSSALGMPSGFLRNAAAEAPNR